MTKKLLLSAALAMFLLPLASQAQIKIGVTISTTGPAASLGIPEKNVFAIMPKEIAGQKVSYIVLDDASDPVAAVKNSRKFVSEDKVDIILGSSITPNSLAMIDVAAESETPMIAIASSLRIVDPVDAKRHWVFKTPQNDAQMSTAIVEHMTNNNVKTVAYIGFSDAYGEGWWNEFSKLAEVRKLKVVANERFNRVDTSVTGQVLKVMAAKADAILIGGAGTPAALPQKSLKEKGYKGIIYQTHGVANNDFLRVCGKDCEDTVLPTGPVLVAALVLVVPARAARSRRLELGPEEIVVHPPALLAWRSPTRGGSTTISTGSPPRWCGASGRATPLARGSSSPSTTPSDPSRSIPAPRARPSAGSPAAGSPAHPRP